MAGERVPWVWRFSKTSYRLIGSNCQECLKVHYPAREICPDCGHKQDSPFKEKLNYKTPAITPTQKSDGCR